MVARSDDITPGSQPTASVVWWYVWWCGVVVMCQSMRPPCQRGRTLTGLRASYRLRMVTCTSTLLPHFQMFLENASTRIHIRTYLGRYPCIEGTLPVDIHQPKGERVRPLI